MYIRSTVSRAWPEESLTRIAGHTPPSRCPAWLVTLTLVWGLSPAVTGTRSSSCTAGTSGSGWRCLDSHSPSTSDTSYGKVVREGEWRDWCQVRRFILIGKLYRDSVYVRTCKLQISFSVDIDHIRLSKIAYCLVSFCQFDLQLSML